MPMPRTSAPSLIVFTALLATATRPAAAQAPPAETPEPIEETRSERLPVPDAIDIDVARLRIRDLFKEEYRGSDAQTRRELARTLLKHADEEGTEPATRWVLLQEARRLSALAGDAMAALRTCRSLVEVFEIDATALKEETLEEISRRPASDDQALIATEAWFDLIDEHTERGRYGPASRAAARASQVAARAGHGSITQLARLRRKKAAEIEKEAEKIAAELEAARAGVATPADRTVAGQFHCFRLENWTRGLPLLAAGADAELAKAAQEDLENPVTASAQQAVAGNWEKIARSRPGSGRREILRRARYWYWKASSGLQGIDALRLGKKLQELEAVAPADGSVGLVDLRARTWESRRWQENPANRMTISDGEEGIEAKNTTTGHWQAHLVCRRPLEKDFVVYVELRGGRTVGLVSADGQDRVLSVSGTPDWQTVIIRRKRGKVQFSANGEPLDYSVAHQASPTMDALVVISINTDESCSIRKLRILP